MVDGARALFRLPKKGDEQSDSFVPEELKGAVFCGHLVADLDSIAGAIGAGDVHEGVAARASRINNRGGVGVGILELFVARED